MLTLKNQGLPNVLVIANELFELLRFMSQIVMYDDIILLVLINIFKAF